MASIIDICNLALGHLGDEANVSSIDPPDGTTQAVHCSRFYAISRDSLLERHAWSFATKRETLAQLATPTTTIWENQYTVPVDLIKPLIVLPADVEDTPGGTDEDTYPYLREGNRILTNLENASLRFIFRQADTTRYSPLFIDTLALFLASKMAGPIIKGKEGRAVAKALLQEAEIMLSRATSADANGQSYRPQHVPDHLSVRGIALRSARHSIAGRR